MNENTQIGDIPLDATIGDVAKSAGGPRFIVVKLDSTQSRAAVRVDRITALIEVGEFSSLGLEGSSNFENIIEPFDTIIARIREVGGVVSSYDPPAVSEAPA